MYSGIRSIFRRYWAAYGGLSALIRSPYLHIALVLLAITTHFWSTENWWEQPIAVLPNLLGFSLGGLAMFLSFGDERFRSVLAQPEAEGGVSAYLSLCSSFVHFIVLQVSALAFALIARSLDFAFPWSKEFREVVVVGTRIYGAIGYLLFLYSVTAMLAATMTVFRVCSWYETHQQSSPPGGK